MVRPDWHTSNLNSPDTCQCGETSQSKFDIRAGFLEVKDKLDIPPSKLIYLKREGRVIRTSHVSALCFVHISDLFV
jgi:hypothetical protein